MNILLVNDDGIDAPGVHKLAEALSEVASVYVCAPHVEQSASGHGITIGKKVRIKEVEFKEAVCAISMEGRPADCVKIGLEVYKDRGVKIDAVFSGFNQGMNLGTDTLYSGTVSAAVEGALCGLPSVAMSISSNFSAHRTPDHYDVAMKLAEYAALKIKNDKTETISAQKGFFGVDFINNNHSLLSINIPDLPAGEIKGIKVVPLGYREYEEWFTATKDEDGNTGYRYSGRPLHIGEGTEDSNDIIANSRGFVTITPLQFDMTNFKKIDSTREEWENVMKELAGENNVHI